MINGCCICDEYFEARIKRQIVCGKPCRLKLVSMVQSAKLYKNHTREYKREWAKKVRDKKLGSSGGLKWWSSRVIASIKCRAKGECNLSVDWLLHKLENGKCEVTGMPFHIQSYKENPGFDKHPYTPSVDKIDPDKGYTTDNCRLVVWVYNRAKGKYSDSIVLEMAKALYTTTHEHHNIIKERVK